MAEYTVEGLIELRALGVLAILAGATPAAMATSVRVHCRPPKQRAASVNRNATLSGPTETQCCMDGKGCQEQGISYGGSSMSLLITVC